jgi:hypothetical protein
VISVSRGGGRLINLDNAVSRFQLELIYRVAMVMPMGSIHCNFSVINVYNVSNATHQAPLTNLVVVIGPVIRVRREIASLRIRTLSLALV